MTYLRTECLHTWHLSDLSDLVKAATEASEIAAREGASNVTSAAEVRLLVAARTDVPNMAKLLKCTLTDGSPVFDFEIQ